MRNYKINGLNQVAANIYEWAKEKGFWEGNRTFAEQIALQHSELSEALEADRHGNPTDDKVPELTGIEAELADCVIRIMDTCGHLGIDLEKAIELKMLFNEGRPYKHGKKY